jgi:hypothetical protein
MDHDQRLVMRTDIRTRSIEHMFATYPADRTETRVLFD